MTKDIDSLHDVLYRHKFTEHVFCMPLSNLEVFNGRYHDLNAIEFYKKINIDALATVKTSNNGKFFYRGPAPEMMIKSKPIELLGDLTRMFEYAGYVYYRRADRAGHEQLGVWCLNLSSWAN